MKHILFQLIFVMCLISTDFGKAQENTLAFPGAEGFGAYATGGRGGDVYIVTNLNDKGAGSLREAIEAVGPRTVVFAVSGIIELESRLRITNGDITIAGQTAPGDGICIKNFSFSIGTDNVIVRYITVRLGIDRRFENDAMNGSGNNIILDHCSMSWAVDETVSYYKVSNFTIQWCIISESLYNSIHSSGVHGMGGIWGGQGASFHHNLLAHHNQRTPRFCGSRYTNEPELELVDHRNNVIYNWGLNSCYGGEGGNYNIVNNYYKSGPATNSSRRNRIIAPRADNGADLQEAGVWGRFYVAGNYVEGYPEVTANNWVGGVQEVNDEEVELIKVESPFEVEEITMQTPEDAYRDVLQHVGASYPKWDEVDARIIEETLEGTAKYGNSGIIDNPGDVGGYPELVSKQSPLDSDKDGIPDEWEDINGLNKNDPEDSKSITIDGYSNLEHYINSLLEGYIPMRRPIGFEVIEINNKKVKLVWKGISIQKENYILERADEEGNFKPLATLNANDTVYTDESIDEYGIYYYRIKVQGHEKETAFTDPLEVNVKNPIVSQYKLSINAIGNGSVELEPAGGIYDTGTVISLTAQPDEGWEFFSWSGDMSGTENPETIIMDEDKSITMNFLQANFSSASQPFYHIDSVSVYPIPVKNVAHVHMNLPKSGNISITIYGSNGKIILSPVNNFFSAGLHDIEINCETVKPGVYHMIIYTKHFFSNKLMVIAR